MEKNLIYLAAEAQASLGLSFSNAKFISRHMKESLKRILKKYFSLFHTLAKWP